MYRLLEVNIENDKEKQAIYSYETKDELEGNFEFKYGGALEVNADELLLGLDSVGNVLFNGKVGNHAFAPRLFEAKYTETEEVDLKKYDTVDILKAKFHKLKGAAIKNDACRQEVLRGFDSDGNNVVGCNWVREILPVIPEEPTE